MEEHLNSSDNPCVTGSGSLPVCAPLAFPYVPPQGNHPKQSKDKDALIAGTLFPGLNLPFQATIRAKAPMLNTALAELMAVDFATDELGLYLDTHPDDREAFEAYQQYLELSQKGRETYEQIYGPISQTAPNNATSYSWTKGPWPWDLGGEA